MTRSKSKVNASLKNELEKVLIQNFLDLKNFSELKLFLDDFLTESELEMFTKRLAIAYWLRKGQSYQNIKNNLKVSSATISSVQSMMAKEGIKLALKNIEAEEWANKWSEKIKKFVGK